MSYSVNQYRHPKDSETMDKILKSDLTSKIFESIRKLDLENIYHYFDQASSIKVDRSMSESIFRKLKKGAINFGLEEIPDLYVTRDYKLTAEIHGFDRPYIMISSHYLNKLSAEMLYGVLASQIAGMKVGHHRILFLLKSSEILTGMIPGVGQLVHIASNQWKRSRFFTYDRAFYLATKDAQLTLQSILVSTLNPSELEKMQCGTSEDLYLEQQDAFQNASLSIPRAYYNLFESQDWAPARYSEIKKFIQNGVSDYERL